MRWFSDGITETNVQPDHHGGLDFQRYQPSRGVILDTVAELKKNDAIRDLSFGRWALSVPFEDYENLLKQFPELGNPEGAIRTKAWHRFLKSPRSIPYRIT